jgi:hypothetical protein
MADSTRGSLNISGILVTLHIGQQQALFVMLGADGSINHMGTGSLNNTDQDLFIGKVGPELFEGLRSKVTDELLQWLGKYADPSPQGEVCNLTIGFKQGDDQELMSHWQYGSESQGPPPEICNFVVAAVEATDPWFEQQKAMARRN